MRQDRLRHDDVRPPQRRRPELDALRVLVVVGLVFFHSALVFDARDDYYVKNPETTEATMIAAGFAVVWAMPMLLLIAGFGAWHSLHRRSPGGFAVERLLRLGVPLLIATATLLPLPQWLRLRAADPGYRESYLDFLSRFFTVRLDLAEFPFVVRGEHFETGHLWFVVLLLAYSLLLTPFARWLPRARARRLRDGLAAATRRRGVVLLPAVPVALVSALVGLEEEYAGWSRWAYLLFFLYGFVLAADDRFRAAMRRDAGLATALGLVLFVASSPGFLFADDPFTGWTPLAVASRTAYGAAGWCWLVAILGLLDRRRAAGLPSRTPNGWLRRGYAYLALAALPLYVLHQPVVVAVAYHVVRWDAPMPVKYAVIVTASLLLTVAAYDLLVRRTRFTRFLFGMRA
ncbi:acyltransferase family protein [Micromonospora sp. WMMD558]|uniref:acyltransferase family protein n=1 Tax=unclassified Micromonospora TaxID=2617518 RepID=UPI0012B47A55|nr:acyltransferase family protein [Micromonospora sp. WMMC415]QGN47401.1 acyltransferase family protein [Micromonospora sp. WMMC415]